MSAYFPLVGRFISELENGGIIAILLGQFDLQVVKKVEVKISYF